MWWWIGMLPALLLTSAAVGGDERGSVMVLQAIGPAVSDYVHRNLDRAAREDAALVVIELDTPGGLDESMREIVQDIIASPVPVAVYVAPEGARAASAGTYITYAAHVAAMAPATNLGAATPVPLGELPIFKPPAGSRDGNDEKKEKAGGGEAGKPGPGVQDEPAAAPANAMGRKVVNDAVAYLRGLAQMRGRNVDWAEQAVRTGASLPAKEALERNVIDLIASDLHSLLTALDGREVRVSGQSRRLDLKDAVIETVEPDWHDRLLAAITHPNIAYMLLLLGFYGLFFELANPGHVLPGVAGAISLLLALYALNVLPVNYAGLALMLIGIAFMIAEMFVPSFGALGVGGVTAFLIGSFILFDAGGEAYRISLPLIGGFALLSAAFFMGVAGLAVKFHRRRSVSGAEAMIGSLGEVLEDFEGVGRVRARGEVWRAHSPVALKTGQKVRVTALDGLTLNVEAVNEEK